MITSYDDYFPEVVVVACDGLRGDLLGGDSREVEADLVVFFFDVEYGEVVDGRCVF